MIIEKNISFFDKKIWWIKKLVFPLHIEKR